VRAHEGARGPRPHQPQALWPPLALTTTRYFAEFFGLKSTDREGIRRLMAEKAGVPYKERPEGTLSDDATEASPLPALESGAAVPVSTSPSPVAAGNE